MPPQFRLGTPPVMSGLAKRLFGWTFCLPAPGPAVGQKTKATVLGESPGMHPHRGGGWRACVYSNLPTGHPPRPRPYRPPSSASPRQPSRKRTPAARTVPRSPQARAPSVRRRFRGVKTPSTARSGAAGLASQPRSRTPAAAAGTSGETMLSENRIVGFRTHWRQPASWNPRNMLQSWRHSRAPRNMQSWREDNLVAKFTSSCRNSIPRT